ncbi:NAD(P)-binding protein [Nemania sp. FL0031]|nr:NAD(P)-binding protein [Nemania sp. FL0031]
MATRPLALITGANGYIAAQTVARFLAAGWAVRGTRRTSPTRSATPVVFNSGDVEYIIGTAVQGTLSILESALKMGGSGGGLKSFVLMSSSVAAMRTNAPAPAVFTEKDWNTHSEAEVRAAGEKAFGHVIYAASKAASERAFWGWVKEKKPSFVATALCPVWVAGPPAFLPSSPEDIAETNMFIWKVFSGQEFPEGPAGYGAHVDVRDVARMTEWAASHPEIAGGERYLVGGGDNVGVPQAAADILREAYQDRRDIVKKGTPGEGYRPGYVVDPQGAYASSAKAIEATGQGWIPYDKMILDAAKLFEGFLQ